MENIQFKIHRPFGPSIMEATIPREIVENLNNYIDKIIADEKKSKELDYGPKLVRDVTQEFRLETELMKTSGWTQFLANCTAKWIEAAT